MNNYPSWWNSTITLYNKFEDPITQLVTWYRTVLTGCFWKDEHTKLKIRDVVIEGDNIICRIRKQDNYVDAETWQNTPADIKDNYFTLGYHDIIILGEVSDTINEYQAGSRSSDLISKYKHFQRCLEIEVYSDNTGGDRGDEHYFVRGI